MRHCSHCPSFPDFFRDLYFKRVLAALYTYITYVYQGSLLDFRVADVCLQTMKISVIARFA